MDLVSIETPSENDLLEELIAGGEISKIMTIDKRTKKLFMFSITFKKKRYLTAIIKS